MLLKLAKLVKFELAFNLEKTQMDVNSSDCSWCRWWMDWDSNPLKDYLHCRIRIPIQIPTANRIATLYYTERITLNRVRFGFQSLLLNTTRKHSSRMRTVRCSGRRRMSAQGDVCLGGGPGGGCLSDTPSPLWTEWLTDMGKNITLP